MPYVYPNICYDPEYEEHVELSYRKEKFNHNKALDVDLTGNLMRYEFYIHRGNEHRSLHDTGIPYAHYRTELYYIDDEGKRQTMIPFTHWWPLKDYDVMGALKQLNSENKYAIYHNLAIKRRLIKKILYFPEIPDNFYRGDKNITEKTVFEYFERGLETPVLVIYWKIRNSEKRSIVALNTSIEEAEKIFNMKIEIMPNPNKKNEDILSRY